LQPKGDQHEPEQGCGELLDEALASSGVVVHSRLPSACPLN
jgi:hypothetical protein